MDVPPDFDRLVLPPVQTEWGEWETLLRVSDLARCLLDRWPEDGKGEGYVTALMVCHAVMSGSEEGDTADDARAAFLEAAFEAGLSVASDGDGPDF